MQAHTHLLCKKENKKTFTFLVKVIWSYVQAKDPHPSTLKWYAPTKPPLSGTVNQAVSFVTFYLKSLQTVAYKQ